MPCNSADRVLLPEPLRPTSPTMAPAGIFSDTSRSAGLSLPG